MQEFKIKCPHCQQNISFAENIHGQVIPCPHCGLSVGLQVPGYVQATPPPAPAPATQQIVQGKIVKKGEFAGSGCLVQGLGLLLIFSGLWTFGITALIGIVLLIVGGRMAIKLQCSNCRNPVASKDVKICPNCKTYFQ